MALYWIALNAVKGVGPVKIKQLLSYYKTPENIFNEPASALLNTGLLNESSVRQLDDSALLSFAEEQMKKAQNNNVRIITLDDDAYPLSLREIFAPPPILYVKGSLAALTNPCIAVVGTRRPSAYGKNATSFIVDELIQHSVTIVSGLALGIDSIAHNACLQHRGQTIAVLGSGIDKIYPSTNEQLAERISEQGALVSEFSLGTQPLAYNFPRRNRIISGLANGTLVVEAGEKSGSLITAHYAIQQGRDVYAIPGSIFSENSSGTFKLISQGAIPINKGQCIIENLNSVSSSQIAPISLNQVNQLPQDMLNQEECEIVQAISDTPQRLDQIADKTKREIKNIYAILLNLELKGIVQQVAGQQYVKI